MPVLTTDWAVDANGDDLAVAWWTRSGDQPKVQIAFSTDAGDTFGQPTRVDTGQGEGQVTLTLLPRGEAAIVGWLEDGQTWARHVRVTGEMSLPIALGPAPFHSLPRWIANDDASVTAVWTKKDQDVHECPFRVSASKTRSYTCHEETIG